MRADRTDLALLLALHSLQRAPSPQGTLALGAALFQPAGAMGRLPGSEGDGLAIAVSREAGELAWTTRDDGVEILDIATDEVVTELTSIAPDDDRIYGLRDLSLAPDGSAVAVTVNDDEVWAADVTGPDPMFEVVARGMAEAAFATYDSRLALVDGIGGLAVRDRFDGSTVWERQVLADPAVTVAWNNDDTQLAVASGSEIAVVDAGTGADVTRWAIPEDSALDLAFSFAGDRLAGGGVDGAVRLWQIEDDDLADTFLGHSAPVRRVAWGLDDETLFSSSFDTSVRMWDVGSGKGAGELRGDVWGVTGLVVSPDGHTLYSSAGTSGVRRWELEIGRPRSVLFGHEGPVLAAEFSADGSNIATASVAHTFVWDTDPTILEPRVTVDDALAQDIALEPDGSHLAVASGVGTLTIYDATDGEVVSTPIDEDVPLWSVDYSDDGSQLVVGDVNGRVTVLDAGSGETRWQVRARTVDLASDVEFTTGAELVVAATVDGVVRWYDGRSGDEVGRTHRPGRRESEGGRTQIATSPDGTAVAVGTLAGEVVLIDLGSGEERLRFVAHQNAVYELAFSPDGLILATAAFNGGGVSSDGFDGGLRLWNASTGAPLANLVYHDAQVQDVAWSADGSWFASAGSEGEVLQWAGSRQWEALACGLVDRELDAAERSRFLAEDDRDTTVCDGG